MPTNVISALGDPSRDPFAVGDPFVLGNTTQRV